MAFMTSGSPVNDGMARTMATGTVFLLICVCSTCGSAARTVTSPRARSAGTSLTTREVSARPTTMEAVS